MKVVFHQNQELQNEIQVEVQAIEKNSTVNKLINYINKFSDGQSKIIPVKTPDKIITIKMDKIIKVEVQSTSLTYYTTTGVVQTTGRLYQALEKLNKDFVQVSRHGAINLNYLESIESGFAGNMVAILAKDLRADVSRRYLPNLESELGI